MQAPRNIEYLLYRLLLLLLISVLDENYIPTGKLACMARVVGLYLIYSGNMNLLTKFFLSLVINFI